MAKSKTPRIKKTDFEKTLIPREKVNNANKVENGLGEALGLSGENPYTVGGPSTGVELSQSATLFKNLRWYMISNMRQLLSQSYVEISVLQNMVDVPIDDAYRGGIDIETKQLDPDQIEELQAFMEQHDDLEIAAQTDKWNRLYGGAGTVINVEGQDPSQPLDISAINENTRVQFIDADMWELFWSQVNMSVQEGIQDYSLGNAEFYDYYGIKLHKSRVLLRKGIRAPSFIRPRLRGWGVSALETLVRSINQYLKSSDLSFEVLDEFKLDIFKIKNLTNILFAPGGEEKVRKRVAITNMQKNYQNAISMDAEDDYIQKQLSFAGLAEVKQDIRLQLASDMRMPLTKLFGLSAQGFNSGEDDIENYNAMIEGNIRKKSKFHVMFMVKLRCQQLFGLVPDDLKIKWKPLRILSSTQEEEVKTSKFNRVLAARQAGEMTREEFRDACNKDSLLTIQLEKDALEELENEESADDTGETEGDESGEVKGPKAGNKNNVTKPKEAKEAKT